MFIMCQLFLLFLLFTYIWIYMRSMSIHIKPIDAICPSKDSSFFYKKRRFLYEQIS
jgi:hypothetical protein